MHPPTTGFPAHRKIQKVYEKKRGAILWRQSRLAVRTPIPIPKYCPTSNHGLRQHLDRVHLPCLVTKYFTYLPRPCREMFGVETDLKKHKLECAEKCKSVDKPSHEALTQLRDDLVKCGEMDPYELAKQQLPVLFDEVNGKVVKRYDAHDKTNSRSRNTDRKSTRLNSSHVRISY